MFKIPFVRRPTSLHNVGRDSDEEDMRDRDYDVAALANNLSQAFRYGIYSNDDLEEVSSFHLFFFFSFLFMCSVIGF
jgi:hypothetical protein